MHTLPTQHETVTYVSPQQVQYDAYDNPYEYNPYDPIPQPTPPPPAHRIGLWPLLLSLLCVLVLVSGIAFSFVWTHWFSGIQRPSAIGAVVTATVTTPTSTIPTQYTAEDIFIRLDQAGVIQHDYTENVLQGPRETYLLPPTIKPSSGVIFGYGNAQPYALLVFPTYASALAGSSELTDETDPLSNVFYGRCVFDPYFGDTAVSAVLQKWCV